ncbi:uncharacterized protein [Henckelia pumila]|uniref:uncharacterized protein n=1 Tax=Henckelia pumila TaxID=405737 RepID=UPI003C6DF567
MANWDHSQVEAFACQTWSIWNERCRALHSYDRNVLHDIINPGQALLHDYQQAINDPSNLRVGKSVSSPTKWEAPSLGHLRLDVDVSYHENNHRCGIGGIVRNQAGQPLLAFGQSIPNPGSITLGDLLAIKEGLKII